MARAATSYDIHGLVVGIFLAGLATATVPVVAYIAEILKLEAILPMALSIVYGAAMFASSYVEEEQQFWYWLSCACVAYAYVTG